MNINHHPIKSTFLKILILAGLIIYPFLLLITYMNTESVASHEKSRYSTEEIHTFRIGIEPAVAGINTLAADSDNIFIVKVWVRYPDGTPVKDAEISLEADTAVNGSNAFAPDTSIIDTSSIGSDKSERENQPASDISSFSFNAKAYSGTFRSSSGKTGREGCFLAEYLPPSSVPSARKIRLTFRISHSDKSAVKEITLVPTPLVLVHGYQASPDIFSGLSAYLKSLGFDTGTPGYDSGKGVASGAVELSAFLLKRKKELAAGGTQIKRFDIIGHSMGGLVARYYTCSREYQQQENVRKLIFLSVPQHGSPFASIGLKYYDDQGIRDLITDGAMYNTAFPSMTNGGLNPSIQTGSLMGRYDEVVSAESASLTEWSIKTELFDIADSNFTIDKLLSGEILQAANHKLILYNRKVYQRIKEMLETTLPYPAKNNSQGM